MKSFTTFSIAALIPASLIMLAFHAPTSFNLLMLTVLSLGFFTDIYK